MFYQTLLLDKFWQVNQAAEQNALDNYESMKLKFKNGFVSEFELLQAEVRWKNSIPETAKAKRNYELALNNLKNWAGIPVENELILNGNFNEYPVLPDTVLFESILKNRPDFNALLWEEQLRKTNVSAKRAAYYPTLTGIFAYNYSAQSDHWKLEQDNNLYFAGVNLTIPIFTGGYLRAEVNKAQIEVDKTRVTIEKTKEDIYNEVTNVYLRLKEAHERISSAEATLKTAKKAFKIAENTAKSGLATQLQLKDARMGFDMANMNYYSAIFDYLAAYFDWQETVGKGISE
jgi:outer membrane protein